MLLFLWDFSLSLCVCVCNGRDNAHKVGLRVDDEHGPRLLTTTFTTQASVILRAKPIKPRRGENVIRVKPYGLTPTPLLSLLTDSSLARVIHFAILCFSQEPQKPIHLEEAPERDYRWRWWRWWGKWRLFWRVWALCEVVLLLCFLVRFAVHCVLFDLVGC